MLWSTFQICLWRLTKTKLFKVIIILWASELGVDKEKRLTSSRMKTIIMTEIIMVIIILIETRMEYEYRYQVTA